MAEILGMSGTNFRKGAYDVVVQVARVESVLFSIRLPACSSVYYKHDLESGTEAVNILAEEGTSESAGGITGRLCIGPDVAQKMVV
jgi:hypothetical protein